MHGAAARGPSAGPEGRDAPAGVVGKGAPRPAAPPCGGQAWPGLPSAIPEKGGEGP